MTDFSEIKKTSGSFQVLIKENDGEERELDFENLWFDFPQNNSLSFSVSKFIPFPGYGNIPWAVGVHIRHPEPLEPRKYAFFIPWIGGHYNPPRPENSWLSGQERTDFISFTNVDFEKGLAQGEFEFTAYKSNDLEGEKAFVHGIFSLSTSNE